MNFPGNLVRIVRWCALGKMSIALPCIAAMIASGRIGDLNGDPDRFGTFRTTFDAVRVQVGGVPLALPCLMVALWALRGVWIGAGSVRGVRWSWSLVLILGACHWARAPLLRVAYDLEGTSAWTASLYAALVTAEAFPVERFLPLALYLVAVPAWSLVFFGRTYPATWMLLGACAGVPFAVELGALPAWVYWLACLASVPVLLSGVRRQTEAVRACALWIAGFCLAMSAAFAFAFASIGVLAPVFASVALIAFTPFPHSKGSPA